jgi:hypothetical protein
MNDLSATAQRLRDVKQATRNFLTLWALEQVRERVRRGQQDIENVDTAAIEAAIKDLDVYGVIRSSAGYSRMSQTRKARSSTWVVSRAALAW